MSSKTVSLPEYHKMLLAEFKKNYGITGSEAIRRGLELLRDSFAVSKGMGDTNDLDRWPFVCVGIKDRKMHYVVKETAEVVSFTAPQHTGKNLLALAPYSWWDNSFPGTKGPNWDAAINSLHCHQRKKGAVDETEVETLRAGLRLF